MMNTKKKKNEVNVCFSKVKVREKLRIKGQWEH